MEFRGVTVELASEDDRQEIYSLRHQIYAVELGQHEPNSRQVLTDKLDAVNQYLVARKNGQVVGFVSVTPPNPSGYSIDKYFERDTLDVPFDDHLYEVRLLSVVEAARGTPVAAHLMYAALRHVQTCGGRSIVAIGRSEIFSMYLDVGFRPLNRQTRSGAVLYELMLLDFELARTKLEPYLALFEKRRNPYYHGGSFYEAIGDDFRGLEKSREVINADVLDAWFDPSPRVLAKLSEFLPWIAKTSPPLYSEGLVRTLAETRGVPEGSLLAGAGSSDLIFLALRSWLSKDSRALILDPTYGEYSYVLETVIGCQVDRLGLEAARNYRVHLDELQTALGRDYDLVVIVNPNSPTGQHVARDRLFEVLAQAPPRTKIWVDETYIDYVDSSESLEPHAAVSHNLFVCKSMSKVYALSGMRCAYLCGPAAEIDALRKISPPWAVSHPAQIAACEALRDAEYYKEKWAQTHVLRSALETELRSLGIAPVSGVTNFLLCQLPPGPTAQQLIARCRKSGLFLRDVSNMGTCFDAYTVRIAVKDEPTNRQMVAILRAAYAGGAGT